MSNKIKQIIDKLQQSNNLIQQQRKEIDKLKSMAISNIVNNYTTESEGEMTESRTYVTEDLWFFCDTCGEQITHHTVHTCFVMNPDILPTLEEWRLICKMVKKWKK